MTMIHKPVMCEEVITALAPCPGEVHVDGTFGNGGYSQALLQSSDDVHVYAIDRDPEAIRRGTVMVERYKGRFILMEGRFSEMEALLVERGVTAVHGITLDIGVSSFQLETAERGFSFQVDGPLDMRMDQSGESAADVIASRSEGELADILFKLGEEPKARRIAKAIVAAREESPILRTGHLASIIAGAIGHGPPGKKKRHPATRSFQALRILVNDELGELTRALEAAERLLMPQGRLAIVAFHSLEDRIVKTFLAERAGRLPSVSRHIPTQDSEGPLPSFHLPRKGAIKPGADETTANPRARSARLRVAIRTDAPAWRQAA